MMIKSKRNYYQQAIFYKKLLIVIQYKIIIYHDVVNHDIEWSTIFHALNMHLQSDLLHKEGKALSPSTSDMTNKW